MGKEMNAKTLSFREPGVSCGGRVCSGRMDNGEYNILVQDMATHREVTFLVHGYRVSAQDGLEKLNIFAKRMELNSPVVMVLWPGDSKFGGISYPVEGQDADLTGENLAGFLRKSIFPYDVTLHFVSHSLGARVVMRAIERLQDGNRRIGNVCLMAAAIDDDKLAHKPSYYEAAERARRIVVLHSRKDDTLRRLYRIGDLFEAFLYKEKARRALGFSGPRPNSVPRTVMSVEVPVYTEQKHGDYLKGRDGDSSRPENCARFARQVVEGAPWPIKFG